MSYDFNPMQWRLLDDKHSRVVEWNDERCIAYWRECVGDDAQKYHVDCVPTVRLVLALKDEPDVLFETMTKMWDDVAPKYLPDAAQKELDLAEQAKNGGRCFVLVKTYSECEGALEAMQKARVVGDVIRWVDTGSYGAKLALCELFVRGELRSPLEPP